MTCRGTAGDRHLDTDDARHAPCDGIRDRPGDTLCNAYGLGVFHRFANCVGNLLDTGFLFIGADRVGNLLDHFFLHDENFRFRDTNLGFIILKKLLI